MREECYVWQVTLNEKTVEVRAADKLAATKQAAKELGHDKIVVAGGVAANSRIRADFKAAAEKNGLKLYIPPLKLCGDNGAMVGAQAYYEYLAGVRAGSDLNAYATMEL